MKVLGLPTFVKPIHGTDLTDNTYMKRILPDGILERPARYPDKDEWQRVMAANSLWPYPAEHSNVVGVFASFFSLGEDIQAALERTLRLAVWRQLSARLLSELYYVVSLYAVITGFITSEIIMAAREVEARLHKTFLIGANHDGAAKGLLSYLRPESEELWARYMSILGSIDSLRARPDEESEEETVSLLVEKFQHCQDQAANIASACCIDYLYNLRKYSNKQQIRAIMKKRVHLEHLTNYPRFHGMRIRVLSSLAAASPKEASEIRRKHIDPLPVPVRWVLFNTVCPVVHWVGLQRHLNYIKKEEKRIRSEVNRKTGSLCGLSRLFHRPRNQHSSSFFPMGCLQK